MYHNTTEKFCMKKGSWEEVKKKLVIRIHYEDKCLASVYCSVLRLLLMISWWRPRVATKENTFSCKRRWKPLIKSFAQGPKMRVARRSPGVAQYRQDILDILALALNWFLQGCNLCGWWDGREKRPRQHGTTLPRHQKMVLTNFDALIYSYSSPSLQSPL